MSDEELNTLADLTGEEKNDGIGFSYSDLRLKVLPEAIACVFPDAPLTFGVLVDTIFKIKPSPQIK